MSKLSKKLVVLGAMPIIEDGNVETKKLTANCMMDVPDYLKGCKPKGRSKADRKRNPRWPRR